MQHTLIAVFDNRADAQNAMDDLLAAGFARAEVRLSEGDPTGRSAAASTAPAADEGSFTSTIKHFFRDVFGTDDSPHAQQYADAVTRGHYVLTLYAPSEPEVERAADIVERHGPVDIDEQAAQWGGGVPDVESARAGAQQQSQSLSQQQGNLQGSPDSMQGSMQGSQQRAGTARQERVIPVAEEELKVGKREVQRGGVRVFSRVVETPVSESLNLREEHVSVERRPVDQPVGPAAGALFQETSIELRETAEEAVVEKTARVVEEVIVGKDVTQREQQISDTVRRTEVEVDHLAGTDDDSDYRGDWNTHYASTGGSYDEYAPAYRYGSSMARNDQYRGRPWSEVETNLRSDWEARNPGSAWEQFKAAVRHGWERITS